MKKKNGAVRFARVMGGYGMAFVLLILVVFFAIFANRFLKTSNIFNVLRQVSIVGIIAVGMTFIMLTGGIDLSCGSIAGFAGVGAAILMTQYSMNPVLAAILMCILGALLGIVNGVFISKLDVPPFIATLGMMVSIRGLAYIITGGLPVFGFDQSFTKLGQGYLGPIPIPVIIMAITFVLGAVFLAKTRAGRHIYGVGGNEEASRLSGVNVIKIKLLVYFVGGLTSALAGLVMLARTNSGQPNAGEGYEMDVITSVVLGGISMNGGQGRLGMVIIGVLIMGVLSNGMTMLGINEFVQKFIRGLVLIAAVALNNFIKTTNTKTISK